MRVSDKWYGFLLNIPGLMIVLCFVLYPTYTGSGDAIVPLGIGGLLLLLYTVFHPGLRGERWSDLFRSSRRGSDTESPTG